MKIFSFSRLILAFLSVCALCCATLRSQTLDSAKTDSVQKPRENWYWAHGSMFLGIGVATSGPALGFLGGGHAGISIAIQRSIISLQAGGIILTGGGGRGLKRLLSL